ncbi:DUF4157 domain-containing protein [Streptomyces sp. NPDC001586]|uniref:eCIS core domain-containing protein n=1 Tax=Streptomyces sp. NPDC001586 TaxID=3154387 RepID=UPI003329EF5B
MDRSPHRNDLGLSHASRGVSGPGRPIGPDVRGDMEAHLGHDLSHVRIHTDESAAISARAIGAPAFTVGHDIAFAAGEYAPGTDQGRLLLGHELTHVIQQAASVPSHGDGLASAAGAAGRDAEVEAAAMSEALRDGSATGPPRVRTGSAPVLQRYEAGEHAKFGEAREELKRLVSKRALAHKVKPGETPASIAARYGISEAELRSANAAQIRTWKSAKRDGKTVQGFNAGETILIPPVVNEAIKDALSRNELTIVVGGVHLDYGEGIAMGDFFADPAQMLTAPDATLQELSRLIKKDKASPAGSVKTAEWDAVTSGRYTSLALRNESHFSPSNLAFAPAAGSPGDHKSSWERHHAEAITESRKGNKEKALAINAFADHFLTDAFAAGHLINKRDVMEAFKRNITVKADKKFTAQSVAFFDAVASKSFVGAVKTAFSAYETVEWKGYVFRPDIDSAGRFSTLLQGIHEREPDLLSNAVVKGVHDRLNTLQDGVPVENNVGDKWNLSGDTSLNSDSMRVARKAVAQSQLNVLSAFKSQGVALADLYRSVWDHVPHVTTHGETIVKDKVTSGTDPKSAALIDATVSLIRENYLLIIKELERRNVLRKA